METAKAAADRANRRAREWLAVGRATCYRRTPLA
jgi:hypothetical protein